MRETAKKGTRTNKPNRCKYCGRIIREDWQICEVRAGGKDKAIMYGLKEESELPGNKPQQLL